jgi:hypothetical protein
MATGRKERVLRDEVRDVLLEIVRDKKNPATARASAARTLIEMDRAGEGGEKRSPHEMTEDEIDAELATSPQKRD